jgi:HAMP domain-containing protein
MVDQLRSFASEVTRVAREVGTEGKLGRPGRRARAWRARGRTSTESVNFMAGNLTSQVSNIAEVTTAVAAGDLSKKITVDVKGEIPRSSKNTVNTMVDQLRSFAAEVTRVAREVGTEGKLGGQAGRAGRRRARGATCTDSVNFMAGNLTSQVRQHRRRDQGGAGGRPVAQDHGGREGRDPGAEGHHQHDGRPALVLRRGSDAGGARRWEPKAASAARPRCAACRACGRTSPTT